MTSSQPSPRQSGIREVYMVDSHPGVVPRYWWMVALRGLAAVIFGIVALALPGLSLAALILAFGAYALVDGILAIFAAIRARGDHLWTLILEAVVGIVAGAVALAWPRLTALILLLVIAVRAILARMVQVDARVRFLR